MSFMSVQEHKVPDDVSKQELDAEINAAFTLEASDMVRDES